MQGVLSLTKGMTSREALRETERMRNQIEVDGKGRGDRPTDSQEARNPEDWNNERRGGRWACWAGKRLGVDDHVGGWDGCRALRFSERRSREEWLRGRRKELNSTLLASVEFYLKISEERSCKSFF